MKTSSGAGSLRFLAMAARLHSGVEGTGHFFDDPLLLFAL